MKFRYKKFGHLYRPVLPIRIWSEERQVNYEVLVDSGADLCIFDAEIGEIIGLDVAAGKKEQVTGIAGQSTFYYLHKVKIEVGGWPFTVEAGFLPQVSSGANYGVVGQRGFFENFVVKFDLLKREIELKTRE